MTVAADRLRLPAPLAAALRDRPDPIVVTGGGGWIGQALLEMLDDALPGERFARRVAVYGSADRRLVLRSGRGVTVQALDRIAEARHGDALYFHCAFLTKDKLLTAEPKAFVAANAALGDRVEAAMRRGGVTGVFVPSSGAVYRRGTRELDDDLAANAYGVMKRRDELRFGALASALGVPACMPRVFNLAGPFINKLDLYALASMIDHVLDDRPIAIRARHRVLRSYVHVADLLTLAITALIDLRTAGSGIFDTRGDVDVELADLADRVKCVLGRPALPVERPAPDPEAAPDRYLGDERTWNRWCAAAGLSPRGLDVQIRDTAAYLADASVPA